MRAKWIVLACWLSACESSAPAAQSAQPAPAPAAPAAAAPQAQAAAPASQPAPSSQPAPAPTEAATERRFGAPMTVQSEPLEVTQVIADPGPHLGKVIQCSGVVARVCERAGCWLELKGTAGEHGLRVPMAGHAFFIPQDAVGRPAVVEGQLSAQALKEGERAHLESEGLKAIGPLSLAATSVVVR